ncbi:MAG: response regulator [Planctomycetes bacterium]|nr:response regulator [Planctomycetota bacterium]
MVVLNESVNILVVDDDEVDVMAVRRAFVKAGIRNPVKVAGDGLEALSILRSQDPHETIHRPYLILLDLNMPRMDGVEFLKHLRADPKHRGAVVFVLTSSKDEQHKRQAYQYHVAGYVIKSNLSDDFVKLASLLEQYARLVELP